MKIIEGLDAVAEDDRGASAAIGNFDGVHRGHQAVLDLARRAPNNPGAPLGVVTFEPHPREVFAPGAPDPFADLGAGIDVALDDEDPPEALGEGIDVGAVALETLTLALDPYPRAKGVAFAARVDGDDGTLRWSYAE